MDSGLLLSCPHSFLLNLQQGKASLIRDVASSEMWTILWHRFSMALRLPKEVPTLEEELLLSIPPSPEPDWTLISPQGIFFLSGAHGLTIF